MTQQIKRLTKWMLALLAVVILNFTTACEEDNSLEGLEIVGDGSLISDPDATSTITAYSQQLKGIRTNMPESDRTGALGVYTSLTFGKTTLDFLMQFKLGRAVLKFAGGADRDRR